MQRKILNSKINYICEKHRYFDELRTVGLTPPQFF